MNVFAQYEAFVKGHHAWYLPILETVKSMTLLLPGRFDDNMVQSETIYSSLNLIGLYNDTILDRPRGTVSTLKCGKETMTVVYAKNILMVLELVEVLIEMIASRRYVGKDAKKKWRVILAIESIKTACRLFMLSNNGGRMVVPASPEEVAVMTEKAARHRAAEDARRILKNSPDNKFGDLISMYIEQGRGDSNPHGTFIVKELPQASEQRPLGVASTNETAAEIFFHVRPVAFVLGRLFCNEGSWLPVIVSALCDVASRTLTTKCGELSESQKQEVKRRSTLWLLYLLRSPVFDAFTRVPLEFLIRILGKIPLFGTLFAGILQVVMGLQSHYFYTSGS